MERLLPSFAVELRSKLLADAQDAVLLQVSDKLWDWASQAPTQVRPCARLFRDNIIVVYMYIIFGAWGLLCTLGVFSARQLMCVLRYKQDMSTDVRASNAP